MQIDLVTRAEPFDQLAQPWDALPLPSPMQSHTWLASWWRHYATPTCELFVVVVRDGDAVVGIAPWYVETARGTRRIRSLGDGQVCSDHATLLVDPTRATEVVEALTAWLSTAAADQWDELQLESIDADDPAVEHLADQLQQAGCLLAHRDAPGTCTVALPADWEAYLALVSKNRRKRCRRWIKQFFDTGRATVEVAQSPAECLRAWPMLVELHNARRHELGEPGAFEDPTFAAFHRDVVARLAAQGQVQVRLLQVDGQVVAAEYLLARNGAWFAYQSGMRADAGDFSPGGLSIVAMLREAITAGCTQLDLLRGTESYKFSWNARHRPAHSVTIRQATATGRLATWYDAARHGAKQVKRHLAGV